eukprot:UN08416
MAARSSRTYSLSGKRWHFNIFLGRYVRRPIRNYIIWSIADTIAITKLPSEVRNPHL